MMRIILSLTAAGLAATLAGCNASDGGMPGPAVAAPPPVALSVPGSSPCSNEINRYQTILKADLETGNVEQRVYDQIQGEMARAAAACSAGRGAEAHKIVATSKAQHGYRA